MSENGEIYTAGKNFTLPPALTAWTNSTSEQTIKEYIMFNAQFTVQNAMWTMHN